MLAEIKPVETQPVQTSTAARVVGSVVLVATVLMVVLLALLIYIPWAFNPRHAGGLLAPGLIGSMLVSGVGGFWMLAVTKRPCWGVIPLITVASLVVLWVFARTMAIAGMH
ncbi:MAG: hypothetical protein ABIS07_11535 [Dokdonella sp.]